MAELCLAEWSEFAKEKGKILLLDEFGDETTYMVHSTTFVVIHYENQNSRDESYTLQQIFTRMENNNPGPAPVSSFRLVYLFEGNYCKGVFFPQLLSFHVKIFVCTRFTLQCTP